MTSPWVKRAWAGQLPAVERTGAYLHDDDRTPDVDYPVVAVGTPRTYTVADLQRAYERELSSGRDADDAAERVAWSVIR